MHKHSVLPLGLGGDGYWGVSCREGELILAPLSSSINGSEEEEEQEGEVEVKVQNIRILRPMMS